jgi:hypothetical protein
MWHGSAYSIPFRNWRRNEKDRGGGGGGGKMTAGARAQQRVWSWLAGRLGLHRCRLRSLSFSQDRIKTLPGPWQPCEARCPAFLSRPRELEWPASQSSGSRSKGCTSRSCSHVPKNHGRGHQARRAKWQPTAYRSSLEISTPRPRLPARIVSRISCPKLLTMSTVTLQAASTCLQITRIESTQP